MRNRLFGFGYYEGYRNDSGITKNVVVLSEAQRRGDFSAVATPIRDPLTGLPFPGNVIPADRISPQATQLLNDFVPLPNSPGNRYIVSPTVNDDRDQFGMRFDYQLGANQSLLGRYMRSDTDRITPRVIAPVDQRALATLQDFMVSHNFVISSNVINQARFSINRITANPAVTCGLAPRSYGINLANTNPAAAGLPSFLVQGFFGGGTLGPRRRAAAVRRPRQPRVAGRRRHHLDQGPPLDEVRRATSAARRCGSPSSTGPNGDLTFNGVALRQRGVGLPARLRRAGAGDDDPGDPGRLRLAVRRLRAGRVPRHAAADAEPRPALRAADAVHRRQRRDHRLRHRRPVADFPAAPAGLVYPGDPGRAPRHRADRQEQLRAAPGGGVGSVRRRQDQRPLGLRRVLRRARRPGRLLPERRAVAAVHAPHRAESTADAASSRWPTRWPRWPARRIRSRRA